MQKAKLIKQKQQRTENATAIAQGRKEKHALNITYATPAALSEWVQRYQATKTLNPRAAFAALFIA